MSTFSADSTQSQLDVNLMGSYGAYLIGTSFYLALWGVSCSQLFLYYVHYDDDAPLVRGFVGIMWLFDTANVALAIASLFPPMIQHWGNVDALNAVQPPLIHRVWLAAIVSIGVQFFFLQRIHKFSPRSWITRCLLGAIALCSLWQMVRTIPWLVWIYQNHSSLVFLSEPHVVRLEISLRAASAVVDIVIAVCMIKLSYRKRHIEFADTNRAAFRLIFMTISSGFWPAFIAIIDLAMIASLSGLQYTAFELPLSSLYVNALLANLNSRHFLRRTNIEFHTYELESARARSFAWRGLNTTSGPPRISKSSQDNDLAIHVDTNKVVQTDSEFTIDMKVKISTLHNTGILTKTRAQ